MKVLFIIVSFLLISCQDETQTQNNQSTQDVVKTQAAKAENLDGLEEDCDDKFEKAQEEKKEVDENNLFGQKKTEDEGCTLE